MKCEFSVFQFAWGWDILPHRFFPLRYKIIKLGGTFGAKKGWFGGRILKNFLICHLVSSLIKISGFGH